VCVDVVHGRVLADGGCDEGVGRRGGYGVNVWLGVGEVIRQICST